MLPNGKSLFIMFGLVALVVGGTLALADDEERHGDKGGKVVRFAQSNPKYLEECGSCHIAYPAGMLPTESWRKIMAGLENHFGTDATISLELNDEIMAYLAENSSDFWGVEMAPLRITETDWFQRDHNFYVIPVDTWKIPEVKSPANCPACHLQAEHGDFSEDNIRMPR